MALIYTATRSYWIYLLSKMKKSKNPSPSACLLALYLPETMDSGLPQTIADMHNMRAFNKGKTNEHRRLIETS